MRLWGLVALAVVIVVSLMLPAKLEQLRTGHWAVEHFLGYFMATFIVCLGWRRPFVVAGWVTLLAAVLKALQSLTPSHSPAFLSALSGAGGALAAALLAKLIIRGRNESAVSNA
jgi:VanZ family protein